VGSGEVPRGEKMLYSGTDLESYITEYTLLYDDEHPPRRLCRDVPRKGQASGNGGLESSLKILAQTKKRTRVDEPRKIGELTSPSIHPPYVPRDFLP